MKSFARLFLVDGDNHIYDGIFGIDQIGPDDWVHIFVTQDGLYQRLRAYQGRNVSLIRVKPGADAVDHRIMSMIGNLVKDESCGRIYIISQDRDYYQLIKRYRQKYGMAAGRLWIAKSIRAAIEKS